MTNSSGCEAPRKKEKLLKACNSAYIHLLQARAPLKQTPHVNTSVWTDAPEKPTALRHRIDSGHPGPRPSGALRASVSASCLRIDARRNNHVQHLCRPTNRFRYVQGLVPEPRCFGATVALTRAILALALRAPCGRRLRLPASALPAWTTAAAQAATVVHRAAAVRSATIRGAASHDRSLPHRSSGHRSSRQRSGAAHGCASRPLPADVLGLNSSHTQHPRPGARAHAPPIAAPCRGHRCLSISQRHRASRPRAAARIRRPIPRLSPSPLTRYIQHFTRAHPSSGNLHSRCSPAPNAPGPRAPHDATPSAATPAHLPNVL